MNKTFQVIFLRETKDSNFTSAVFKVDPVIREAIIKNGNRVFLGLSSCKVTDRFHLVQCYHCQQFGHKKDSDYCPRKNQNQGLCLYCANNHLSRDCPDKKNQEKHKCANCMKSKDINRKNNCTGHSSNSYSCPILLSELKSLINRTMGYENVNLSNIPKNVITT